MTNLKLEKEITALLVIDPYNDFTSEGGQTMGSLARVGRHDGKRRDRGLLG